MLKIWGRANSMNVQKAMWAVGELGIPHERIDAGGKFGGLDTRAISGDESRTSAFPPSTTSGVIVWESGAVVRYLAARYGSGSLWPADPGERARADQLDGLEADHAVAAARDGCSWAWSGHPPIKRNQRGDRGRGGGPRRAVCA